MSVDALHPTSKECHRLGYTFFSFLKEWLKIISNSEETSEFIVRILPTPQTHDNKLLTACFTNPKNLNIY